MKVKLTTRDPNQTTKIKKRNLYEQVIKSRAIGSVEGECSFDRGLCDQEMRSHYASIFLFRSCDAPRKFTVRFVVRLSRVVKDIMLCIFKSFLAPFSCPSVLIYLASILNSGFLF